MNLVLEKHHSYDYVAIKICLNESNIRKWDGFYRECIKIGLLARKNKTYSINFKIRKIYSNENLSLSEAYIEFNIPTAYTIIKWQKDFSNFGLEGLQPKPNQNL